MRLAVVIPVRDSEPDLSECLEAVASQTRAADEVFIVVGPSNDGSMALARRLAGPNAVVRDNPAGDRGSGINIALRETRADLVAMVDVRARLAPDYLETALNALEQHSADVVGGPMRPQGRSAVGRTMAAALQSGFGIGDSRFHFAGRARQAESVYLGVYLARTFAKVGLYNPVLLRTEDDDMNARIREAGFQIWLDPDIRSTYFCRESLAAIWRQYHGYGYWKVALAAARPGAIRLRHFVPAAFVLALVGAAMVSVIWWPLALPLVVAGYFLAGWIAALFAPETGPATRLLFPIVTLAMHLAYGTGTLMGLVGWPRLRSLVRRGAGPVTDSVRQRGEALQSDGADDTVLPVAPDRSPPTTTMTESGTDWPTVTLVVPVFNEGREIDRCLEALTVQTYPRERLRIIVVDGASTDETAARVAVWMDRDDRIAMLPNPDRLMAIGLNLGIAGSTSDVVGVISGHSSVEPDYVERAIDALRRTGAWCVGARVARESSTPVQRAIARAASSPIGVGDARHNYARESGWAEAAFPGMWHRWVFDRIGFFDGAMAYNEDNELSHRILAAGGRIWFEASIVVRYVPRASLGAVFTQYRRYGRGKVGVVRKHRTALRWRHLVPPAWVAWLTASALVGLFVPAVWLALGVSVAAYAGLLLASAARARRPGDPILLTVAAFAAIHAGYGIGVWQGVLDLLRTR